MTKKDRPQKASVLPFDPRQRDAMEMIRRVSKMDTSRVKLSRHALEQMEQRNIVARDVYRALQMGDPIGPLKFGNNEGELKLTVTFQPRGMRNIGVVTLVVTEKERVFVKTVMWMDEQ